MNISAEAMNNVYEEMDINTIVEEGVYEEPSIRLPTSAPRRPPPPPEKEINYYGLFIGVLLLAVFALVVHNPYVTVTIRLQQVCLLVLY